MKTRLPSPTKIIYTSKGVHHYPTDAARNTLHLAFFECDGEASKQVPPWPHTRALGERECVGGGRFLFLVCVRVWEAHGPP